ncbi:MAG: type II secretion system protein GspL [Nevskiaceae bacterium]|jgi:general secretion pathway protein L|nr:type II secretion system protein GspL [Nevskiaceae bacterium]
MADWLLLRIAADPGDPITWALADGHGQLQSAPVEAALSPPFAAAAGRRVALLLPGSDVLQLTAALPPGNTAKLQQLAPFALEDQLSEDIESLHFAVGARADKEAPVPVRVVSRELLEGWIAQAQELGLTPQAAYTDSDLLPVVPGHVVALLDAGQLTLRAEDGRAMVLSVDEPAMALELLLGPDAQLSAVHLAVQTTARGWQLHRASFEALRERLASMSVQILSGGVLAALAPGIGQAHGVNLLQGNFHPQQESGSGLQRWRLPLGLAAALLLLHLGASYWQLWQLKRSEAALDQSLTQIAAAVLPGEPPGGNLRRRVEQRMGTVSNEDPQGDFLHVLAAVAAAHDNVPSTRIGSLSFKPGELEMNVSGTDAANLEQLNQALRAGGYQAEVSSGQRSGTGFEGRIVMRSGAR